MSVPKAFPGHSAGPPGTAPPLDANSYEAHPFSALIAALQKHLLLSFSYNVCLHLLKEKKKVYMQSLNSVHQRNT